MNITTLSSVRLKDERIAFIDDKEGHWRRESEFYVFDDDTGKMRTYLVSVYSMGRDIMKVPMHIVLYDYPNRRTGYMLPEEMLETQSISDVVCTIIAGNTVTK